MSHFLMTFLYTFLALALIAGTAGGIVLYLTQRRLKQIKLRPDATFFEALREVPLGLVVGLDLLDLGFDFLAAPFTWVLLQRTGLTQLRQVAVIESLLPGTQLLPTMTLAWLLARMLPAGFENSWLKGASAGQASKRGNRTIDVDFRPAR